MYIMTIHVLPVPTKFSTGGVTAERAGTGLLIRDAGASQSGSLGAEPLPREDPAVRERKRSKMVEGVLSADLVA